MKQLAISVLVLAFISGCKKNNSGPHLPYPLIRKTIETLADGTTATRVFEYDGQGRLRKITTNGAVTVSLSYGQQFVVSEITENGEPAILLRHLDGQGLVDTSYVILRSSGDTISKTLRLYNGARQCVRLVDITGYRIAADSMVYEDGNNVRTIMGSGLGQYVRTFRKDIENTTGFRNTGMSFLGADNKNAVALVRTEGSFIFPDQNHEYELDEQGRISRMRLFSGQELVSTTVYEYY